MGSDNSDADQANKWAQQEYMQNQAEIEAKRENLARSAMALEKSQDGPNWSKTQLYGVDEGQSQQNNMDPGGNPMFPNWPMG